MPLTWQNGKSQDISASAALMLTILFDMSLINPTLWKTKSLGYPFNDDRNEWQMERGWRGDVMGGVIEEDGGWKHEEPGRKQRQNQRLAETARWMTGISLRLLPPSYTSINFLLQRETLTPSFLLFLGPINNLICCHMIMLRPGIRLPSLLNEYFSDCSE